VAYTDALEKALGRVIADMQQRAARQEAEGRAVIAELRAKITELESSINKTVAEKLATIKDGKDGEKGEAGPQGEVGPQGDAGPAGPQGLQGEKGTDGINGEKGEKGDTGEQGEAGPQGAQGQAGLPGERGADGSDGSAGPQGERGERGLTGEPGRPGEPGARGDTGEPGKSGEPGAAGPRGERGEKGLTGERGEPGQPGQRGDDGLVGERGEKGERGEPGRLPIVKEWAEGVHYAGDVVTHMGGTYQALKDTAHAPLGSSHWVVLAARGSDGQDGLTPRVTGTYSPTKEYKRLDLVALNSGTFVALKDGAGACPGADWQVVAGPGKRGERGPPGERGLPGKIVEAPEIVGWKPTKNYTVIPVMSDGREGAELSLRSLFEAYDAERTET